MKAQKSMIWSLICLLTASACSQEQVEEDPLFEYTHKSAKVVEAHNSFGLDLFRQVNAAEAADNLMISPASVSIALSMAANGAEGKTRLAFEEVLDYEGLTREEINEINRELITLLLSDEDGNLLKVASSLWYHEAFPVAESFIEQNKYYFDAEVQALDFRSAEAVETINSWVSSKTHEKIKEIVTQIAPEDMMILINAIYFNCLWEVEFNPDDTYDAPFLDEQGQDICRVDMMQLKSTFSTSFSEKYSAVELPYRDGKFSMLLLLPEQQTLDQLIASLDGSTWREMKEAFTETQDFHIHFPRFKFEYERSLSGDLKALGLDIAFTEQADFSGISQLPLLITDVIHKSFVEVNEAGTEAAAVTAISFGVTSVGPPAFLKLDRPFLFAITENNSGSIVFIGKVGAPKYE